MSLLRKFLYSVEVAWVNKSIESRSSPAVCSFIFASICSPEVSNQIHPFFTRGVRFQTFGRVGQPGGIDLGIYARHSRKTSVRTGYKL